MNKTPNEMRTWKQLVGIVAECRAKRDAAQSQEEWTYWEAKSEVAAELAMKRAA